MSANDFDSLLRSESISVKPEWIDSYGHMNAGRYFSVFVDESYKLMERLGMGRTYASQERCGIFVVGAHIQYQSELRVDETFQIRMRVLEIDHIRLLVLCELVDLLRNKVAATFEQLYVHTSLDSRKATPFKISKRDHVQGYVIRHAKLALPPKHIRYLQCRAPAPRTVSHA